MISNQKRKIAGVLAALTFYLSGCGAHVKLENIQIEDIANDAARSSNAGLIAGEKDYEKQNNINLSKKRNNLEEKYLIYDFLNQKGLCYMKGLPSLLDSSVRADLSTYNLEGIKYLYNTWEKENKPYLEGMLAWVYNDSYNTVRDGLSTAIDSLSRLTKLRIANAINQIYKDDFEQEYITNENLDYNIILTPKQEDELGRYVIYVRDGTTEEPLPYYVSKKDNEVYSVLKAIYEAEDKLNSDESLDIEKILKIIEELYNNMKLITDTIVIIDEHNNVYTLPIKEIKEDLQKKYGKDY